MSREVFPNLEYPSLSMRQHWEKNLMENNLLKRGIVKADWCCMCKSSSETVNICCCTVQWPMICGVFFFFFPFLLCHWDFLGHAGFCQVYDGVLEWNDEAS